MRKDLPYHRSDLTNDKKEDVKEENNENKIILKNEREKKKKERLNKKAILEIPDEIVEDMENDDEKLNKIRKKNKIKTERAEKNKKEDGKCNNNCTVF